MDLVKRFEVFYIDLDPTKGSEIKKIRPCVIISPNEMNNALNTVIVAPLTSTIKNYPMRVNCVVDNRNGQIALDQIRTIDKLRLKKHIGTLDDNIQSKVVETLIVMFS